MIISMEDPPAPWIKPNWKAFFSGFCQFLFEVIQFWMSVQKHTPDFLAEFERQVHVLAGRLICDPLVAFAFQNTLEKDDLKQKVADLVKERAYSRLQKRDQTVKVRFLGGSEAIFVTPYYLVRPPKGRGRPTKKRGKEGNGYYPELELLGIYNRVTPATASLVAAQLCNSSVEEATSTLSELGLKLNSKTVRRIGQKVGNRALKFQESLIESMNIGHKGNECKGKRLAIAVDGGRLRTRKNHGRKRRSTRRYRYKGEWREPKVFVIYELDEQGRLLRKTTNHRDRILVYGSTMGDADACFQILAAHLCHLGANEADEVTFIADGGEWIWNRIGSLLEKTGIERARLTEVIDFYHVTERLYEIAKTALWNDRTVRFWVKSQIIKLKSGHLKSFLDTCSSVNADLSRYFHNHSLRLCYRECRKRGLPMGSGAIESGVRRIINLRFKGNGIFWGIENAESLMHLRCERLSGRWSKMIGNVLCPKEHWQKNAKKPLPAGLKEVA